MLARSRYRDLVWQIARDDCSEGIAVTWVRAEEDLLDPDPVAIASTVARVTFPLPAFLEGERRRHSWSRRHIQAGEAMEIGAMLWEALPDVLTAPLLDAEPGARPLRLKITSDIRGAGDLPWEWLARTPADPVALWPSVRLARSVPSRLPVPPLSAELPLRVLIVTTNPKDARMLDVSRELAPVMAGLARDGFDVRMVDEPQVDAIRRLLADWPPHIFHYIGHGGISHGDGSLIVSDVDMQSFWVTGAQLAEALPSCVRLLCLSTCFTTENFQLLGLARLARAANAGHLPTTITNQYPVGEPAVWSFWGTFYNALLEERGDVNEAVQRARLAVAHAEPDSADWGSFSLVIRDQTGIAFDLDESTPARVREEFEAQYVTQLVNELAEQLLVFGPAVPPTLRRQFDSKRDRASKLIDDLSVEGD